MKHKMKRLIRDAHVRGAVLGVEANSGERTLNIKARKAVILGSGGWKGNPWLRRLFDPRMTEDLVASGEPFVKADGTGIIAALELGAALASDRGIDGHLFHRMFGTRYYRFPTGSSYAAPGLGPSGQLSSNEVADLVLVNKSGLRYVNEALPEKPALFYDASLAQKDHVVWAVFDDATAKRHGWDPKPPLVDQDLAFRAPSVRELARLIHVPPDALVDTVQRYNGFVETGNDPDFGKPKDHLKQGR